MVLLSIWPCGDRLANHGVTQEAWVMFTQVQDDDHAENCAPTCLCACCGLQIILPSLNYLNASPQSCDRDDNSAHHSAVPQHEVSLVWQPPKLA